MHLIHFAFFGVICVSLLNFFRYIFIIVHGFNYFLFLLFSKRNGKWNNLILFLYFLIFLLLLFCGSKLVLEFLVIYFLLFLLLFAY